MAHERKPSVKDEQKYIEKERQWLLIHGEGSEKIAFLNCYIACQSFTSEDFIEWNEDLFQLLTQEASYLMKEGFMLLAMGDFNTRVGEIQGLEGNTPDVNRNQPMFMSFVADLELIIINTLPISTGLFTRFKGAQRSLLDYGLVDRNHVQNILSFKVDEDARFGCSSDHALLDCEVQFHAVPRSLEGFNDLIRYNFHENSDFTHYKDLLERYLLTANLEEFSRLTLPEMLNHIVSKIHQAALDSFGLKTTKRKKRVQLPQPIRIKIQRKREIARSLFKEQTRGNAGEADKLQKKFNDLKHQIDKDISDMRLRRRNRIRQGRSRET